MTQPESAFNPRSNPRSTRAVAKNTSYFTLALILQKIISFSYFAILAHSLAPEYLGKYYLAVSFTTMFAIFMDLGLANVLVRESAKFKERAGELLGAIIAIKLPLAVLTLSGLSLAGHLLGYSDLVRQLIYLSALAMLLDSFTTTFYAVIRGFQILKYESAGSVIFQLIVFTLGILALRAGLGLKVLILALVSASLFNFLYSFSLLYFKFKIKLRPIYKIKIIKPLVLIAIPFGLFGIFQRLYMYFDTVLLSKLATDFDVGIYQIAFKIVFALQFLPMAFIASLYPAFASYWKDLQKNPPLKGVPERSGGGGCNTGAGAASAALPASDAPQAPSPEGTPQLVVSFERAMNYLIIISLPISIGIIVLADKVLLLFKPEYASAAWPLRIIMLALIFIFLNFPIGALLNACDRQKKNTLNIGIALILSVTLNLILIPRYQAAGAAITVLATNMLMFIIGISWVPEIIIYRPKKILWPAGKALLSAAVMGTFALALKEIVNIVLVIPLSGILYFGLLFILGGFRKEDIISIMKSFFKKAG